NIPLISIMHTRTPNVDDCLDVVQSLWSGPIGVYAHSGSAAEYTDTWIYEGIIPPNDYKTAASRWIDRGVSVIGTCCGLGVEHIETLAPLFK
ncbi:MAG: homocysteine S-methyltransferase family protein, partial [Chloroflexota bacterium]